MCRIPAQERKKMRRNSVSKMILFILAFVIAAVIAVVIIRYFPVPWGKWKQPAFFAMFLVIGSVLELLVGKFAR